LDVRIVRLSTDMLDRRSSLAWAEIAAVIAIASVSASHARADDEAGSPGFVSQIALKISSATQGWNDELGRSVAYREPFLITGAPGASSPGVAQHGSAIAWRYSPQGWIGEALFVPEDAAAGDQFGMTVAIARPVILFGNRVGAAIGAERADVNGLADAGAVHMYRRNGGSIWAHEQKLVASDPQANAAFGQAVAMDGDLVAIGAPKRNGSAGAVYLFRYQSTGGASPSWVQETILKPSDIGAGDLFGISIDVVGDTIVVGAAEKKVSGIAKRGAVYVFKRTGQTWAVSAVLTAPNGQMNDKFGQSVSIDRAGMMIAVGTNPDLSSNLGAVHVFDRSGSAWIHSGVLTPSRPQVGEEFGRTLSVDEGRVVVGAARRKVDGMNDRGTVFIYERDDSGIWVSIETLVDPAGLAGDRLGSSVVTHGEATIVGARGVDGPLIPNAGATMVFWTKDCDSNGALGICNPIPGELLIDGFVDGCDLAMLLCKWGPAPEVEPADFDHNGAVDGQDLAILLGHWTGCP